MTTTYPCPMCNMDEGSPVCLQDERCPSRRGTAPADAGHVDQPVRPRAWMLEPKVQRHPDRYLIRGIRAVEPTVEEREFAEIDGDRFVPLFELTLEDVAAVNAARKARAEKALRRLDLCLCDHNEYCRHW